MQPSPFIAPREARVFSIAERVGAFARSVVGALKPKPRPEPWREHDPRKSTETRIVPATPPHLLGAGGRAEFFHLPRN